MRAMTVGALVALLALAPAAHAADSVGKAGEKGAPFAQAWGADNVGQLGNGAPNSGTNVPVTVSNLTGITGLAAGLDFSLALLSDGTVWAWGSDNNGQLGNGGTNTNSSVPVQVPNLTGVKAIAAGDQFALALLKDGTVRSWGDDDNGQLGDGGTNTDSPVPVTVTDLRGVTAISGGDDHSLALLRDGTVRSWGDDDNGQLGDGGTNTDSPVPVTVSNLTRVQGVAAGGNHSLAFLRNGTVRSWGDDSSGQLGDGGTNTDSPVPVTVSDLTGVRAVAAGRFHSLALLKDGTVRSWGRDASGQLGDGGTNTDSPVPVTVSNLTGVKAIATTEDHNLAIRSFCDCGKRGDKTDSTGNIVFAWGENGSGQLGNGSTTDANVPVAAVTAIKNVAHIAAGGAHSLAA
ncbi:hypothetical protein [Streptomyces sp. NPDC051211]|uniref:RCC1 domain-containing protein n=1 Tax=Streptomyces sp. NPDC051211 TaxID=3154643 RepID=UPI003450C355